MLNKWYSYHWLHSYQLNIVVCQNSRNANHKNTFMIIGQSFLFIIFRWYYLIHVSRLQLVNIRKMITLDSRYTLPIRKELSSLFKFNNITYFDSHPSSRKSHNICLEYFQCRVKKKNILIQLIKTMPTFEKGLVSY